MKNSETVTITKAEYDSLKQIESEFNWLKEQLQITKKKAFGSSSERTEQLYEGISLLFNEAELIEDVESKTAEITVEKHTRKKKCGCIDKLPENVETYTVEHELSDEERTIVLNMFHGYGKEALESFTWQAIKSNTGRLISARPDAAELPPEKLEMLIRMYAYMAFGMLVDWFSNEMSGDRSQAIEFAFRALPHFIEGMKND